MQTDNAVGEICKALAANGFADNTLVIFTSDNGCSKAADIPALAKQGHKVSAHMRGSKADIWDGGHRVPFVARWPGHIKPGTSSDQLICLTDLFATVAHILVANILDIDIPTGSCEDSVSFLPALSGRPITSTRKGVIHHSISGHFAYRTGNWKLILACGSGGWTSPRENQVGKNAPDAQLYDLATDPSEKNNLYLHKPEVADQLLEQMTAYVKEGRSTEGAKSKNDIDNIVLWKSASTKPKRSRKKDK